MFALSECVPVIVTTGGFSNELLDKETEKNNKAHDHFLIKISDIYLHC